ncbi:MAG: hypothetical protein R3F60_13270 [bacterium]
MQVDRLPGLEDLSAKEHRALMWQLADDGGASAPEAEEGRQAGPDAGGAAARGSDDA